MVGNVAHAWTRVGQQPQLAERWDAACTEWRKIAPKGQEAVGGIISEIELDRLNKQISERRKELAPPPMAQEVIDELGALGMAQYAFNGDATEVEKEQRWLNRARDDWRFKLIGLDADLFLPNGVPRYSMAPMSATSVHEVRMALKDVEKRRSWLRDILNRIQNARSLENEPSSRWDRALFFKYLESQAEIAALQSANMALEARLDRLEKHTAKQKAKAA
jgi:hypothetical protein